MEAFLRDKYWQDRYRYRMKMRQLEARTGVNRETIRVYLRHGLVPKPSRPRRNVADYDERHIKAVFAVRDLQRDNGLTLPQIKNVLSGKLSPRRVDAGAFQHLEALVATRVGLDRRKISIASLVEAFPNVEKDAQTLMSIGIINILKSRSGPALSVTDARLLTIWEEMRAAGFTEKTGFTPDVLEFYIAPSEFIATREASIFLDRTEGKIPADEAAAMLQSALRLMLDFFGLLRMKAFMRRIHRDSPAARPAAARPKATKRKTKTAIREM